MKSAALVTCWKCDGKGHIPGFERIVGGVCFSCNGAGVRKARRARAEKAVVAPTPVPVGAGVNCLVLAQIGEDFSAVNAGRRDVYPRLARRFVNTSADQREALCAGWIDAGYSAGQVQFVLEVIRDTVNA